MTYSDTVWRQARTDLVVTSEPGHEDLFIWEHAARVARTAVYISRFPVASSYRPDGDVVLSAALYNQSVWVQKLREDRTKAAELLSKPSSDQDLEQSAQIFCDSLAGTLPDATIVSTSTTIRLLNSRSADKVELCIVSDALSLEEFSFASLWPIIRRGVLEGRGVQSVLDTWDRRGEYQYWSARLKDGFHFEPIRTLARKRLADFEQWIDMLKLHHHSIDVEESFKQGRGPKVIPSAMS